MIRGLGHLAVIPKLVIVRMGKMLGFKKTRGLMGGGLKTLHRSFLSASRRRIAPLAKLWMEFLDPPSQHP
jgi:hypothetical protein